MRRGGRAATALLVVAAAASLVALPRPVRAQDQDEAPPAETRPPITARYNVDWLTAMRWSALTDSSLNPDNARLRLPQFLGQTELRGNVRVEIGQRLQLIVRPRVRGQWSAAWSDPLARQDEHEVEANWTELYAAWRPTDAVSITWGLQIFQWGPAELLAPNNRIFHEVGIFKDPIYYQRGRHLLRANLSAGKQWSVVTLAELGANGDDPFRAGERFARQGLVKLEYSRADGTGYGGITAGVTDGAPPWFGLYGSLGLTEGLSVYADTSHTHGSRAWYPVRSATGRPEFARPYVDTTSWRTLAILGARYTFTRGDDLRVEWLGQDAGWTRDDLRLGFDAARLATSPQHFAPYMAPGLEFMGRQCLLLSLRTPDLPPAKHVQVQWRYLQSFTDASRVFFATGSYDATDALVVFASVTWAGGDVDAEFSRFATGSVVVGTTYTW